MTTNVTSSHDKFNTLPIISDFMELQNILTGQHAAPYEFLGLHPSADDEGLVLRVFRSDAASIEAVFEDGQSFQMTKRHPSGFFDLALSDIHVVGNYQLKIKRPCGEKVLIDDPFQFTPSLKKEEVDLFKTGNHRELWKMLGAHFIECFPDCGDKKVRGVRFAVWAPNAWRVSVVGDFNNWDDRIHPMLNQDGVWVVFIPEAEEGQHYKYKIVGKDGALLTKSDPFAFYSEHGSENASKVYEIDQYDWNDVEWMSARKSKNIYYSPMSIYEVHLGSWKRKSGNRYYTYKDYTNELVDYVVEMGFTHIEIMPLSEYPFDGSWGYQVCGYYAPTSRFGTPAELKELIDTCHRRGIGVIMDWVPAHFPRDAHGLSRFDGSALFEYEDPRIGEHKDWGTLVFNHGKNEVRNFLIANALYWFKEFHVDGIRVDAVSSMLYLDYSREDGQWIPNRYGGRENLDAIDFIKELNRVCYQECPGIVTIAEESTAFPSVSKPTEQDGLGFGFKWNMGWMNDWLHYMSKEPVHRKYHHNDVTFSMIYAYHENFILPLSHDEVVHGKGSMLGKMPGDQSQQFANLRMLYAWMYAHPGKKLLFQGNEIAQPREWDHDRGVDWNLPENDDHLAVQLCVKHLNHLYISEKALNELDHEPDGFEWLLAEEAGKSLFAFKRRSRYGDSVLVIVNATPVRRDNFRIGVFQPGVYEEILNTDSEIFGGTNVVNTGGIPSEPVASNSRENSVCINLPPLATVYLRRREV